LIVFLLESVHNKGVNIMQVLESSTCIAHYCLQRRIARGGMSHVYLAQDIFTEQLVALKLVDKNQSEHYERLQREIRTLSDLTHNHILPTLDYGPYHSWYYLVTPYIEHGTLRERLARGPLTIKEAGSILEQVTSALQFAHDHGVIHRDIKPSNILLRNGDHVYLTDFGLVKLLDEASDITQTGCMPGTPAYVAPELIEHDATPKSDIYALGIVLYQMLTGHVPFKSTTPIGAYWKHLSVSPQPPSVYNPAIPPAIDAVVLHALEKNPEHRFARADEFAQSYRQALVGARTITYPPIETQPVGTGFITSALQYRHASVAGRRRAVAVLLAAVIFFFITPLWLGFTYYSIHYRSELPTLLHASVPLTVDHLPVTLDFPPTSLSHHHQPLPAITLAPPPPSASAGWSWSYQSPPPHKHRQKHKADDKQEHKADDKQKQESQAEDRSAQNSINSSPEQSSNQLSNMPHRKAWHVRQPDVRPLLLLQIP
jgi:serine/threonine protein kinase